MFNVVACCARWGLVASIEIEVGVKRRVPLLPWGHVAGRPEMTLEAQSLAYIPCVCVFPVCSGFTPGWAYVLVGGCAACLICPRLGTCRIFDVSCTALVDVTVRKLCRCCGNIISYLWAQLLIHRRS